MRITVTQAVLAEADEHSTPPGDPIECATAKTIAQALATLLAAHDRPVPPHLRSFIDSGAITVSDLHDELCDVIVQFRLGQEDLLLVNALIWYIEWCGDADGGPSWRFV